MAEGIVMEDEREFQEFRQEILGMVKEWGKKRESAMEKMKEELKIMIMGLSLQNQKSESVLQINSKPISETSNHSPTQSFSVSTYNPMKTLPNDNPKNTSKAENLTPLLMIPPSIPLTKHSNNLTKLITNSTKYIQQKTETITLITLPQPNTPSFQSTNPLIERRISNIEFNKKEEPPDDEEKGRQIYEYNELEKHDVVTKNLPWVVQRKDLRRMMELLLWREHQARILLIYYRRNVERLLVLSVEKGKLFLFMEVSTTVVKHLGKDLPLSVTSTMTCGICLEEDEFSKVECSCYIQFCFCCLSKTHSSCSCMRWELRAKKCLDKSEIINWITVQAKPYPKCHKLVGKNGCGYGQAFCCRLCIGKYIVRIMFGPCDKYLREKPPSPYIQKIVDGALTHILTMSKALGEQFRKGHLLERNKLEQLLKQEHQLKEDVNLTYKVMRIEGEKLSVDVFELMNTNTKQAIEESPKVDGELTPFIGCTDGSSPRGVVVGDGVLIKLQHYKLLSRHSESSKFQPFFYCLFLMMKRIGMVANRMQFLVDVRIQDEFHVLLLKPDTKLGMNVYVNKHWKEMQVVVQDKVLLMLQPYKQFDLHFSFHKLQPRFCGSFLSLLLLECSLLCQPLLLLTMFLKLFWHKRMVNKKWLLLFNFWCSTKTTLLQILHENTKRELRHYFSDFLEGKEVVQRNAMMRVKRPAHCADDYEETRRQVVLIF